jgi:succinyl-diaminopimelate desuccinylase
MVDQKKMLLDWIEDDKEKLVDFLIRFVKAKSPNPPGDTRIAMKHVCQFLDQKKLLYRVIAPLEKMPNIVSSFECDEPGHHLILNGHLDVFPAGRTTSWNYDPWGGIMAEGRIYGRGVADMKCGTTASIFTFAYLHRIRSRLKGRLTLTCVSDEENFGPWGSRYLMEHHPEVHGDCCLSGEPSNPHTIHFGEKGLLWLTFTVHTRGAYGPHTHVSPNAIKIAARLITDIEALSEIRVTMPSEVEAVLYRNAKLIDQVQGRGAAETAQKITVNIGTIRGGVKVNMVPGECTFEVDIRLPVGVDKRRVMTEVEKIAGRYPEVSYEEINYAPPNWCEPYGVMAKLISENVRELKGYEPEPVISLGGTDAKLWRYHNVPAYLYGPFPGNICAADEYVELEDFFHIVRTHVLSAYDYLRRVDS